jgi:predicted PurR-regulated permease PerM
MTGNRPISVTITPGTIVTALLYVALIGLLFYLRELVFVVLTAIVIASAVEPAVAFLERLRVPRVVGVLTIYTTIIGLLLSFFYFFVPPLLHETSSFLSALPTYFEMLNLEYPFNTAPLEEGIAGGEITIGEALRELRSALAVTGEGVVGTISAVFGGVLSFCLIIVLSFYFAVQDTGIDDFLRVVTPVEHQKYVVSLWRRSQRKIGYWMQGQLFLSFIIFVLVYVGLMILGVRHALLLAVLAAILELIPVFGSILAAVPAVAIAFLDSGTSMALIVIALYILINQFQGNVVYPLVVQKIVGVPPLLVILALIAGAQLAGFLGIILSVPVAVGIKEFVNDVQKKKAATLPEEMKTVDV